MEILLGKCTLQAEYRGDWESKDCYIIIKKDGEEVAKIVGSELIAAIKALGETCWRP